MIRYFSLSTLFSIVFFSTVFFPMEILGNVDITCNNFTSNLSCIETINCGWCEEDNMCIYTGYCNSNPTYSPAYNNCSTVIINNLCGLFITANNMIIMLALMGSSVAVISVVNIILLNNNYGLLFNTIIRMIATTIILIGPIVCYIMNYVYYVHLFIVLFAITLILWIIYSSHNVLDYRSQRYANNYNKISLVETD